MIDSFLLTSHIKKLEKPSKKILIKCSHIDKFAPRALHLSPRQDRGESQVHPTSAHIAFDADIPVQLPSLNVS